MIFRYLMLPIFMFTLVSAEEYKAVFDCSSSDAAYIKSRMQLVERTIDMIEKRGDKTKFVMTLHGGCVPVVSSLYHEIVDDRDIPHIKKAQQSITSLSTKRNVKVIACAMSLKANAMDKEEVLPFVDIVENSFIDTIYYQNKGYALMTFK